MNNFLSENLLLISVAVGFALLLIIVIVLTVINNKKKKLYNSSKKVKVNDVLIENILSCFKADEINSVDFETSRVKFDVKNIENVDLDKLKKLSTGIFITGSVIKAVFTDSAEEIVKKINNR